MADAQDPSFGEHAPKLARSLGNARPMTLDGQGHGASDTCVQSLVNAYFLDGTVPANNATCT